MEFNTVTNSVIAALILIPLNAYINLTIKFAPDKNTVYLHFKSIILKTLLIALNISVIYLLYKEVTLTEPLTRKAVFSMIQYSSILIFSIFSYFINLLMKILEKTIDNQQKIAGLTLSISEAIVNRTKKPVENEINDSLEKD